MKINPNLSIVVICGGPGKEAEVSRSSAAGVAKALRENYKNVQIIELDHQIDLHLRQAKPDVVFPIVHGKWGEDGHLQGLLTILGIPFVGSDMQASVLAMDKVLSKQVFALHGLPIAKSRVVYAHEDLDKAASQLLSELGPCLVIKPTSEGSGLGVSFADNTESTKKGLVTALRFGKRVLVEERIDGAEITAAVLEGDPYALLPVIEIRTPSGSWYDYEHRYTPGLSEHLIPAPLPADQYKRVQEIALKAHQVLGCRDLSRADFVVPKKGEPILLEVNTLPGMTPTSLFPDAAQFLSISFPQLVSRLIEQAFLRRF